MIPKVIHYVWLGKGVKNLLIQKCMQSWYTFQQEWEIKCWNEDNLPLSHPYVQLALDHKQYAFASDYLRIYILLSYGGIYLDTDMEIIRPLDDLMNNQAFIGYEDKYRINASILGACSGNLYLHKVLLEYDRISKNKKFEIICDLMTRVYCLSDPIEVMSSDYFYPYNPYSSNLMKKINNLLFSDISENTYTIHHWNKSWTI